MSRRGRGLPLLAFVEAANAGEDADFDFRFRQQRPRRWLNGIRNGISIWSMIRLRAGLSDTLNLCGVPVDVSDNQVTCRVIEDIWMRGEYDLPGFIPQPGWRVIDIGGNVGIFAMLAASRGARVTSYEPHPESFRRLSTYTAPWQVDCHHAAVVGQPCETVKLYLHRRHTRHTVVKPATTARQASIEVPAIPVADILTEPCDLLKVDCEGLEFELFAAVGRQLRMARRIIAELHTDAGDATELADHIAGAGFDVLLHDAYQGLPFQLLTAVSR